MTAAIICDLTIRASQPKKLRRRCVNFEQLQSAHSVSEGLRR
jgi:hypothetical protein